jgi:hypothetical protein
MVHGIKLKTEFPAFSGFMIKLHQPGGNFLLKRTIFAGQQI